MVLGVEDEIDSITGVGIDVGRVVCEKTTGSNRDVVHGSSAVSGSWRGRWCGSIGRRRECFGEESGSGVASGWGIHAENHPLRAMSRLATVEPQWIEGLDLEGCGFRWTACDNWLESRIKTDWANAIGTEQLGAWAIERRLGRGVIFSNEVEQYSVSNGSRL